jgi:putative transposase
LFEKYARTNGVAVYAFCLMNNHVHFLVKPARADSLAKTFKLTHHQYSCYVNTRMQTHGHRWQSRFYSCIVLGSHIPAVFRYVERNPVRANMVRIPWDYPWSSARMHAGFRYRTISMADVGEYIDVPSWKDYLLGDEHVHDLDTVRTSTLQGKVFGPAEMIRILQAHYGQDLLPRSQGRPLKR